MLSALDYLKSMYDRIHTNAMRNTPAGHWINEAFVVRLWAVLEAHNVVSSSKRIDKSLDGADKVHSCNLLRNKIAHSSAEIGSAGSRAVDRRLREVFDLGNVESIFEGKYVLSKDKVLRPMWRACRDYSVALLEQECA